MIETILTAVAAFVATGLDELVVLTVLFVYASDIKLKRQVYLGQEIGMLILLGISTLAVMGIMLIPREWVGLLGFLPMIQGIRIFFFDKDEDDEEEEIQEKLSKHKNLLFSVAIIAVAGGAEELAIYIPYFSTLSKGYLIIVWITFLVLVPFWCSFCLKISSITYIKSIIERFERIIIPITFIGLGMFVLLENGTIQNILNLLW